jgi:XTP/dITP diphosphohydrolase
MKIVFATHNAHKVSEVQAVLGSEYQLVTATEAGITEEIPETQPTIEGNALQKARYVYEHTGLNCFADDTGLEVEALNGAPGVYSARYAGEHVSYADNNVLLLKNLAGCENRKARFRTVIALIVDGKEYLFEGRVEGTIATEPHGEGGFGYDPLFVPEGSQLTFAEMSSEAKNKISHRGRAVAKLVAFLHGKEAL